MRHWLWVLGFSLCLISAVWATEERPTIGLVGGAYPVIHQPVTLLISHASYPHLEKFEVKVTYRPNSETSKEEILSAPNDNGELIWTPTEAGITLIQAQAPALTEGGESVKITQNISVRFGSFPVMGMLIFVLAALALFGGLILVIVKTGKPQVPQV